MTTLIKWSCKRHGDTDIPMCEVDHPRHLRGEYVGFHPNYEMDRSTRLPKPTDANFALYAEWKRRTEGVPQSS